MKRTPIQRRGFSLSEVVISMGLFSFALVVLVGMLPIAYETHRSSIDSTRAAKLAGQVFSIVRAQPINSVSFQQLDDSLTQNRDLTASSSGSGGAVVLAADSNGIFYGHPRRDDSSSGGFFKPLFQRGGPTAYEVEVRWNANSPEEGLTALQAEVVTPGGKNSPEPVIFTTVLRHDS